MTLSAAAFVRAHTQLQSLPFLPELRLHLASQVEPVWRALEAWKGEGDLPPPFWAFAWAGGQGLARFITDHPDRVAGRRVLDFASGGGVVALAAAKAGAREVTAADIDELAHVACQMNAAVNGAVISCCRHLDLATVPRGVDLIVAGDVCYDQLMAHRVLKWLRLCAAQGVEVWLGDPGRAYVPQEGVEALAQLTVPTSLELEDKTARDVTIWRLFP